MKVPPSVLWSGRSTERKDVKKNDNDNNRRTRSAAGQSSVVEIPTPEKSA